MMSAGATLTNDQVFVAGRGQVASFPRRRLLALRIVGVGIVGLGAVYLGWRMSAGTGTSSISFALWVAELIAYLSIVLTVVTMWQRRVREGPPRPPRGTLDVFVPVCGEPAGMVKETVSAALAIAYPHQVWLLNDGCRADKTGWREIDDVARALNVRCLTRTEGSRGKAGNLNNGLRHSSGEFIAVIDADHRAHADFAHELLGYFDDPSVALVTTPQLFEVRGEDVLNNLQPFFYGHQQPAKDAANAAFSCGNGVVYRRSALEEIGGFSEWNLVEDLHTTYRLHAAGLETVYHPKAVTVGTAPATAAGLAKQQLTWAIDSLRILFFDSPLRKRGLTLRQRVHYLHTTTLYLTGIAQLVFWVAPFVYLALQVSAVRGSQAGTAYVATAGPYYASVFLWLAGFVGVRKTLRTTAQRTFLAPVFVVAALKALCGQGLQNSVTEKVRVPRFSLLLLPMIGVAALTAAGLAYTAVIGHRQMAVVVAAAAGMTLIMSGMLTAVTHDDCLRRRLRVAAVACTVLAAFVFAIRAF